MAERLIDFSSSVLPHLEPFAGLSFALNLAYIGLPRFRYRKDIQERVSEKLRKEVDGDLSKFQDTDWYKGLSRLAALKDDKSEFSTAPLPKESWATGYKFWFEKHVDRKSCIATSFILGSILALGSAHSAGHFGSAFGYSLMFLFDGGSFKYWFSLLMVASLLPVFFVARGNSVVGKACAYADDQIRNMKATKQTDVQSLPDPLISLPRARVF